LSVEEIYKKMIASYYQNDYEWNRSEQIKYVGKGRLEGSHRVIYGCPKCKTINKIKSTGDIIYCNNCDMVGEINDFGFIDNTKFDNFVEWGYYQETLLKNNLHIEFNLDIELFKYDLKIFKKYSLGKANLEYTFGKFSVTNKNYNNDFMIKDIRGEVYSEALNFSFDYKDETFMFRSESPKLLLDLTKFNKED
jgi:phage FluMu protein Com